MPAGTLLYAQSGGVTAVINATAAAVITGRARAQGQGAGRAATASSARCARS